LEVADNLIPEYYLNDAGTAPTLFENNNSSSTITSNQFSTNTNGDIMKLDFSKIDFSKAPELKSVFEALQNENTTLEANLTTAKIELQAATQTISASQLEKNRDEVLAFCESPEMKLKIMPAEKDKIINMLLAAKERGTLEFSSADNPGTKIQLNPFEYLKETLKQLPNKIELQELATKEKVGEQIQTEYQKMGAEIAAIVNPKK
jgi:hypothetical protein